jgi:hypothetical protein
MRTWTNMAWPDDPYRTSQQLYRRPAPKLAAFAVSAAAPASQPGPTAAAIVYLPLHRTEAVTVSEATVSFGFRAVSADDPADLPALAAVADLDLMQARRHAAVLAGYRLADDLARLRHAGDRTALRGLAAVEREWAARGPVRGQAVTFDCGLDLPGRPSLGPACQRAGVTPGPGHSGPGAGLPAGWQAAALAVERALMIALVCGRHQGRYAWPGTIRTGRIMAVAAWDCLPWSGPAVPDPCRMLP